MALITAAGVLLAWAAVTNRDGNGAPPPSVARTPSVEPSAGHPVSPPAGGPIGRRTGTASQPPSAPAQGTPNQTPLQGVAAEVPAGFHRYRDPSGFSVAVPNGWRKEVRQGHVVYFREPGRSRFMLIDQEENPPQDMLASSREQERNRRDGYREYRRVRLERIGYRGENAADWEFTYAGRRQRLHVLIRSVLPTPKRSYGIYWSTPDAQWDLSLSYFRVLSDTFQPAPG